MSKQENDCSRRKRLNLLRRLLVAVVAILMGAIFVLEWSASAHNIDVKKAREVIRNYARRVRDESGGKYAHFSTSCVAAFPGHNHIAVCVVDYQNEEDTKKNVYTCRERIDVRLWPHERGLDYTPRAEHMSAPCGNIRLYWTPLS